MTHRTVIAATYSDYLDTVFPDSFENAVNARALDFQERQKRLAVFPYSVLLQASFAEVDFANRWCWQQFGPASGDCCQAQSDYPTCHIQTPHTHEGKWMSYWLAKTDYNFGYNEWCFLSLADCNRFLEFVPEINWGEHFPK